MKKQSIQTIALFISFLSLASTAIASQDVDRQYSLESVGVLRASDNVDGIFGDYVGAAYREYFNFQGRFQYVDLSKADPLFAKTKIQYSKLITDNDVLKQVAKTFRVPVMLRTRISKEGPTYRFNVELLHLPKVDVLASDQFVLEEPRDSKGFGSGEIKTALFQSMDRLVKKIPFLFQVTGRDQSVVTVAIQDRYSVEPGDTVVISTLEEVKRHPLLNQIVDWRFVETGRARVESIDGGIAFCKVIEENADRPIGRFQKVTDVIVPEVKRNADGTVVEARVVEAKDDAPKYGWLGADAWIGAFSREYSTGGSSSTTRQGSGFFMGMRGMGQLWLTRSWFTELGFGYGFSGITQSNPTTGATSGASVTASLFQFRADVGYTLFSDSSSMAGPKAWGKVGYLSNSYSMPASATDYTGSIHFGSFFAGVGGEMPFRGDFGGLFEIDFGLFNTASETGYISGDNTGASQVEFYLGGYYRIDQLLTLRFGLGVSAQSADFRQGPSVSNRVISFGPTLIYHF